MKTLVTCLFFFGISVRFFVGGAAAAEARPNIVVILADDLGIGDMSAYRPGADVQTAHLDRLAAEGMRFSRMRANATVCSPTRAALMSGRYADRVGVPGLIRTDSANTWGYFDPNVPTIANHLRAAGRSHPCCWPSTKAASWSTRAMSVPASIRIR